MNNNTKLQTLCVWSGPLFLVLYLIAFAGLAGYLPPQPPSTSAIDIAGFYSSHAVEIRAGMVLCMIFATLLFPFFAIISAQIAATEGRFPVLAIMQFGAGVLLIVYFMLCSMVWIVATFRPELDPNTVRVLHDFGWLTFVMVFPEYTLQLFCIAAAGFRDKSATPFLPRWACYFNLWVGISGGGGGLAAFFKIGPFAWNGLFGFWLPVAMFAAWLFVMTYLLLKNVKRHALQH